MAVATEGSATNAVATAGTELNTASRTTGTGSNRCLVAHVGAWAGGSTNTSSVTFDPGGANEQAFTALASATTGNSDRHSSIWYAEGVTSGASGIIRVNYTSYADAMWVSVTEWTGVDQTTPMAGGQNLYDNTGTPSVTVPTVGSDDYVCDAISAGNGVTVGANQVQQYNNTQGSNHFGASIQAGSDGGVMSWTLTSAYIGLSAGRLDASAATAPAPNVNEASTVTEDQTMHMPIDLRMEKVS